MLNVNQSSKIRGILALCINGQSKEAAKKVNKLSKYEIAHCLGGNAFEVMPDLVDKDLAYKWENFIVRALEGFYS